MNGLKSNDSANRPANLAQENPPIDFQVDYLSKPHARPFGRFDFLNTVLLDMSDMALKAWNLDVPAAKFPTLYGIAISFVSDRSGPGLLAKHIMWALEAIFDTVLLDDQYRPGNVVVKLGPTALGVGSVRITIGDSTPVNLSSDASMQLNAHGRVQIRYWYREQGMHLEEAGVYSTALKLLIKAAEPADLKASIWPGLSTYSDQYNLTFTIRPQSLALSNDFSWLDTIFAVSSIPLSLYRHGGAPGKFMELDGSVRVGTTVVGAFCLESGDKIGFDLQSLCNRGAQETGDDGDGVAIS